MHVAHRGRDLSAVQALADIGLEALGVEEGVPGVWPCIGTACDSELKWNWTELGFISLREF